MNHKKGAFFGKYILAAIDGTDSSNWVKPDGSNSHVHRFYRELRTYGGDKAYFHGPKDIPFGSDTEAIIHEVLSFLRDSLEKEGVGQVLPSLAGVFDQEARFNHFSSKACKVSHPQKPDEMFRLEEKVRVVLVGHSRGGLVAICVAKHLGFPVHFLGLFDAVDMHYRLDGGIIENVDHTAHALRHAAMRSRDSFGNTGLRSTGVYGSKHFMTSHGGMGGDPVYEPESVPDDFACNTKGLVAGIMALQGVSRKKMCERESLAVYQWITEEARKVGMDI